MKNYEELNCFPQYFPKIYVANNKTECMLFAFVN